MKCGRYCLLQYTVARTDTLREDANLYQEDAGTAALYRRFPAGWRVLVDSGNTGECARAPATRATWAHVKAGEAVCETLCGAKMVFQTLPEAQSSRHTRFGDTVS